LDTPDGFLSPNNFLLDIMLLEDFAVLSFSFSNIIEFSAE